MRTNEKQKDKAELVFMGITTFICSGMALIAGAIILGCILLKTITVSVIIAVPLAAVCSIFYGEILLVDFLRMVHEYKKKWK